jgi:2-polyprenyl-3-methyl-5-hydroxy-6-metoxy-1,4-benzoquinol methylase
MEINDKLAELERTLQDKDAQIQELMGKLKNGGHLPPAQLEQLAEAMDVELVKSLETTDPTMKELTNLLHSSNWPPAVDPSLICDSEIMKEERAEGILEIIIEIHLEGLKLLDFGCGEGHVINRSRLQNPKLSVAYDTVKSPKWDSWEKTSNVIYTDDWNIVKSSGPYNVILMYDVIDHMVMSNNEIVEQLKKIKTTLAPNGKIYVRCHPWCSRHGTHLYHQLNKAFAHIVFTRQELEQMGHKQDKVKLIKHPVQEYEELFKAAGLRVTLGPNVKHDKIEPFFTNTPVISERIKAHYQTSFEMAKKEVIPPLAYHFVDYVLG